jgi:hypothetical protein
MPISKVKFTFSRICVLNFHFHKTTLTVPVLSTRQYLHAKTCNKTEECFTESTIATIEFLLLYVCLISQTVPSHCSKMQVYDEESCECKCVSESEIKACGHPKEWDPNLCSCVCPQSLFCSTGAHIHPDSCQ